jgi:hypothetical protein
MRRGREDARRKACVLVVGAALGGVALAAWPVRGQPLALSEGDERPGAGAGPARAPAAGAARAPARRPVEPPPDSDTSAAPAVVLDPRTIDRLVADLLDDHVPGNATAARAQLTRAGAQVAPALERALASTDRQQRVLAALILWELPREPSLPLLEFTVGETRRGSDLTGAAVRWLLEHEPSARRLLTAGVGSEDAQQRFLCAFLLGRAGRRDALGRTCWTLIEHLGDNEIRGDALMAAHALWRLGEPVLPFVRAARPGADRQAGGLLDLVELDIHAPPGTRQELARRRARHDVTGVYDDPVVQLDLRRSVVATW